VSLDAVQLKQLTKQCNAAFSAMRRARKSYELAVEKAAEKPNDERLQRDRGEKSRTLHGVTSLHEELRERLVKSWE